MPMRRIAYEEQKSTVLNAPKILSMLSSDSILPGGTKSEDSVLAEQPQKLDSKPVVQLSPSIESEVLVEVSSDGSTITVSEIESRTFTVNSSAACTDASNDD